MAKSGKLEAPVVAALRPRDLAYLAAVVDSDKGEYPRKQDVLENLQLAWKRCRLQKDAAVFIVLKTCHQEDRERRARDNISGRGIKTEED